MALRVSALAVPGFVAALLAAAAPVRADGDEPGATPVFTAAGEVTGTIAPEDRGYFNETDYGHNVLRQLRARVTARWQPHRVVALVAEVRTYDMETPEVQALYLRLHPFSRHALDLQAGLIPPVFGTFTRRYYEMDSPFIGYPVAYQYLMALRPDAVPATAAELRRMRGRGWLPRFSVGSDEERAGLPLMSALEYDTGVELRAVHGSLEAAASVTQGTLGSPRVGDDNGGKQLSARVALRPTAAWVIGASAARGPYLADDLTASVPTLHVDGYRQTAWEADVEFSSGYWLARAEVMSSSWDVPQLAAPLPRPSVRATTASLETRVRVTPRVQLGVRGEHLAMSRLTDGVSTETWEAPLWRVEGALGYTLRRHLRLRAAYQYNWRDGGFVKEQGLVAGQVSWWF